MEEREINMITYGSTTLTSYNTITKIEVYYYQSTSPTTQTGGSWSTTKPTWVDGRYVWQKIRTTYEGKLDNGSYYSESDPVNITGQQGATGTSAYSYKLNASDTIVTKSETGELSTPTITFSAIFKQGTSAVTPYAGRFKIEVTTDKVTWVIVYPTSGTGVDESSVTFTIPENTALIKCSLYQSGGLTVLLDHITIPIVNDGVGTVEPPYKEVEWVESTGKQYVYLDWKPPIKTWGFEIDFISRNNVNTGVGAWNESTNVNGYGSIFGVRNASGVNNCQLSSYSNGLLRIGNSTNITTGFKTDHSRQTIKLQGTTVTKTDGTTATVTRVDENTAKPYCNMTVFAVYTGLRCQDTGGVSEPSSTRIYSLKFYDGTTLTVDLVGAIRKADGVTGLYDKVSRHFYPAPGMLFGNEVGNINDTDTVAESLNKADVNVTVVNKNRTRMWETAVPFNRLEDGQKITVTYSYGTVVNSIETAELPEWNESTTSGNNRIYLKLTYPNGSKSEWIPCYYAQTTRLTTHYGAGTPITLTYHENILANATETAGGSPVVRGFFASPVYYLNYYDRRLHNNSIKAKDAINAYRLICGDEEGYQNIDALVSFDLGYPILYASGSIAATKTATNTYEAMSGVNFTYTGTIQNGEANKMLWLKGTINGNTFTVAFGDFLTTVTPTMEDGMYYIPLGIMVSTTSGYFSSSNRLYAYIDGVFQPVDTAAVIRAQDAKNLATAVYGTCSTAADTPLKEVVCENFILFEGVRIQVAFENANSTNVPSLNVNNTGAKQILINQAIVSESNQLLWAEDAQMEFVYDGTYWVLQNAPYSLYGICSVTEEIPEKVIECAEAVICKGTTITVDFMYSNTSDNTVFNVANIAQKPLLVNGDVLKVNSRFNWHAGAIRTFYFDGQAWNMSDDIVSAYIDEYETEQNEDGIMVHPVGQKNTGWSIGSTLELLKNGVSYIKMWFDKVEEGEFSLPFIRIGKESGNHVLVGDDAVTIREDQKELAHYSSLGITFDDETPYKIGNDTTYIAFEDTDNDAKADSLRIVADSISFHSNGTEKDLRSELEGLNENIDLNAQAIEQNAEAIENTQKYIQINPEVPSIKLATNDRNYLLIESNKLGFWVDANETAYMSQNQMNIPTASITNLLMQTTNAETGETIGQIGWVMRTNGHLSLKIMN